ncbi:ER-retained PMA1-suppressing protein 1 [Candida viswanathii]|uniref:ER-retained PMA1-suppressing protein 1 n=1 Tax=Candida viswanathii TaxID=5486 RepID=A0A367XNF9_9ASCO|nr:ER-retained PMA1-suppressing protein 1 [Candida viswanathii]
MKLSLITLLGLLCTPVTCEEISKADALPLQTPDESPDQGSKGSQSNSGNYPDPISLKEFDRITSEKLVLVEFFSPYCHHCKEFAPTWKEAFFKFQELQPEYNIEMRQVNCVESGDLCEREHIDYYPNLQLYAPALNNEGKKTGKLKNIDTFPRNLDRTVETIIKYLKESYAEYDSGAVSLPSSSKMLDVDTMLKIIDGDIDTPTFVAFFPATAKQWDSVENKGKLSFTNCPECIPDKRVWDRLSNQVLSITETGHFMCRDHSTICENLKIGTSNYAQFIMFLPRSVGIVRFDYDGFPELEDMKKWVSKLFKNSRFDIVSARGVTEVMEYTKVLSHDPIAHFYPLQSKVVVLFYYEMDKVTPEDEKILPHLLKMVQLSPFNVELHKAKHTRIEENVATMGQSLIDYINYDENDKYEFDKALQVATTLTSKPTILVFKDNSLIADVYQSFAPEDMRNHDKIEQFIKQIQYPLYGQLTPEMTRHYFNKDDNYKDYKIVVLFVDMENMTETDKQLYNLSLMAHEYHYLKQRHYYDQLLRNREEKMQKVKQMKERNAEVIDILKEMREQIPHMWNTKDDVLFTFIDQPKARKDFRWVRGWNLDPRKYEVGDIVILSKDGKYYTDKNTEGKKLVNDPKEMKRMMTSFLNRDKQVQLKLLSTPYGGVLGFMDYVHQYGFLGYLGFFAAIYIVISVLLKLRRFKRKGSGMSSPLSAGLIGNFEPKKD